MIGIGGAPTISRDQKLSASRKAFFQSLIRAPQRASAYLQIRTPSDQLLNAHSSLHIPAVSPTRLFYQLPAPLPKTIPCYEAFFHISASIYRKKPGTFGRFRAFPSAQELFCHFQALRRG